MISWLTDGWDITLVAGINAFFAWVAGMIHVWAAVHTSRWLRKMFITIASLAFFYSLAYWWLFWNPGRGEEWSSFLRPFGIITWFVAWAIEPVVLVRYLNKAAADLPRKAERAIKEARQTAGVDLDGS